MVSLCHLSVFAGPPYAALPLQIKSLFTFLSFELYLDNFSNVVIVESRGSCLSGFIIYDGQKTNSAHPMFLKKIQLTFMRATIPTWLPSVLLEMIFFDGFASTFAQEFLCFCIRNSELMLSWWFHLFLTLKSKMAASFSSEWSMFSRAFPCWCWLNYKTVKQQVGSHGSYQRSDRSMLRLMRNKPLPP